MRDSSERQPATIRLIATADDRRRGGVEDAQQIEAGEQAADDAAGDVAAVEETEPRHAFRRRGHPARDRRQRRAHQQRRRQEADAGSDRAQDDAGHARSRPRRVDAADQRHAEQHQHGDDADAGFEQRVDPQRMLAQRDHPRQQQAAEAHAAHERAEQDAERDRRRPDDQLQQLEPDDFVDQRGAAAADEEQEQRGKKAARGHEGTLGTGKPDAITTDGGAGGAERSDNGHHHDGRRRQTERRACPARPAISGACRPAWSSRTCSRRPCRRTRSSASDRP